ncbi:MAG: RNA methyltransferase [Elusimicrobiota bacterium]
MRSFRIVLIRPRNPNNIGAAARAMANFGLDDLAAVEPHEPIWRETRAAVGGEDVMRQARNLSLSQALCDCHLILATSTGRRRKIDRPMILLPDLNAFLDQRLPNGGTVAILFGSEKTGLGNDDINRCHAWIRIPTKPRSQSMNLGQAVAVVAYELRRSAAGLESLVAKTSAKSIGHLPPAARQVENLWGIISSAAKRLDFKNDTLRDALLNQLRRSLPAWNLTRKDVARLQMLFGKLARKISAD